MSSCFVALTSVACLSSTLDWVDTEGRYPWPSSCTLDFVLMSMHRTFWKYPLSWPDSWAGRSADRKVEQGQDKGYCSGLQRHRCVPQPKIAGHNWCHSKMSFVSNLHTAIAQGRGGWRLTLTLLVQHLVLLRTTSQVELEFSVFSFGLGLTRNPHAACLQQLFWDSGLPQKQRRESSTQWTFYPCLQVPRILQTSSSKSMSSLHVPHSKVGGTSS